MRAIDKRGNFNEYFRKRFIKRLRELYGDICKIYETDGPEYFEIVPEKIESCIDFIEMMIDCGFSVDDNYRFVEGRLMLFSQALCMGELQTGDYADKFIKDN
ncbi:MAG: hypothetical protein AABX79_02050, partial [Nanoarchaeota archaeon]